MRGDNQKGLLTADKENEQCFVVAQNQSQALGLDDLFGDQLVVTWMRTGQIGRHPVELFSLPGEFTAQARLPIGGRLTRLQLLQQLLLPQLVAVHLDTDVLRPLSEVAGRTRTGRGIGIGKDPRQFTLFGRLNQSQPLADPPAGILFDPCQQAQVGNEARAPLPPFLGRRCGGGGAWRQRRVAPAAVRWSPGYAAAKPATRGCCPNQALPAQPPGAPAPPATAPPGKAGCRRCCPVGPQSAGVGGERLRPERAMAQILPSGKHSIIHMASVDFLRMIVEEAI